MAQPPITAQPTPVFATTDTYDGIGRALSTSATRNGTTIWNQTKSYDNVGNTSSLTTTLPTIAGGTQTDSQSFCYDALNRLVWGGNTGTPSGGDHCGSAPSGTTTSNYQQAFSYDALDRLMTGPAGTETYNTTSTHAATTLSTVPNQYASYDARGDMTCRNVDTTVGSTQSCDATQTGALMSYDSMGRLSSWTAPGASTATPSDQFLYDNGGNRVLQRISNGTGSPTDTISFDSYTDVTINGSQTSTTKYYTANGEKIALRTDGVLSYLIPDQLGSTSLTLYADGSTESVQLYTPYGATRYSDGATPTVYGFTGQRSDSTTGLMYYNARYYDPLSGRFISADDVQNNAQGDDPFAYVADNPATLTDPTGHSIPRLVLSDGGASDAGVGDAGGGDSGGDAASAVLAAAALLAAAVIGAAAAAALAAVEADYEAQEEAAAYQAYLQKHLGDIDPPFIDSTRPQDREIIKAADKVVAKHNRRAADARAAYAAGKTKDGKEPKIPTFGIALIFDKDGKLVESGGVISGTNDDGHAAQQLTDWTTNTLNEIAQSGVAYSVYFIIDQAPCPTCQGEIPGWKASISQVAEAKGATANTTIMYLNPSGSLSSDEG